MADFHAEGASSESKSDELDLEECEAELMNAAVEVILDEGEGGFFPKNSRRGATIRSRTREEVVKLAAEKTLELKAIGLTNKSGKPKQISSIVCKAVSNQLRISESTYRRILSQSKACGGRKLPTPGKKRPKTKTKMSSFDSLKAGCLRRKINILYAQHVFPTIKLLLTYVKEELNYDGGWTTLLTILKNELGFKYKKVNGRKLLMERHDVRLARHNFLKEFMKYKSEGREFIFLDETCLWERHAVPNCGKKIPSNKGRRLIVLHAGGRQGFIPHCLLTIVSNPGMFHHDMNADVFTQWFKEKLLPNIPAKCAIVMDNVTYHSVQAEKCPTTATTKSEMMDWLQSRGVLHANTSMLKVELYQLVKENKPRTDRYVIDELAAEAGHAVLRIPPYHCEYNPIELVWQRIKENVCKRNTTFKIKDVNVLTNEECSLVDAEFWQKCISHTDGICDAAYAMEATTEMHVEQMIINMGTNEEDDSEDSISDSDSD